MLYIVEVLYMYIYIYVIYNDRIDTIIYKTISVYYRYRSIGSHTNNNAGVSQVCCLQGVWTLCTPRVDHFSLSFQLESVANLLSCRRRRRCHC